MNEDQRMHENGYEPKDQVNTGMTTTRYVVGFKFNRDLDQVALIRKLRPEWQRGLLNGVGGKIEPGETPLEAMVREFREETGGSGDWTHFLSMAGEDERSEFYIEFFYAVGDLDVATQEEEQVEVCLISHLLSPRASAVDNLRWIVPLALCQIRDSHPGFITFRSAP